MSRSGRFSQKTLVANELKLTISMVTNGNKLKMDFCKLKEPKVINDALLHQCIINQYPKGEGGRLARLEPINYEQIFEIRLEFQNILRIDHLWVLTSLTKLSLNNNFIETIENLESLTNLVELNLSFNKIEKIENLEALVNLEKLSLYNNVITIIENIDTLKQLKILTIGRNLIDDPDQVLYLRKFPNLQSLNLAGNPCAKDENFRYFVAAFLPKLQYYEYRSIEQPDREKGTKIFQQRLRSFETEEEKQMEIEMLKEQEEADAALNARCFVEYLNTRRLYDALFEEDEEGRTFFELGDEAEEFYNEFQEQFLELCQLIFNIGQEQYTIRQEEIDQFRACVAEARLKTQTESIKVMEEFLNWKNDIFAKVREETSNQESPDKESLNKESSGTELPGWFENYAIDYSNMCHQTWKTLMKLELDLFEQMEDVNSNFEHILTEMVNQFIEAVQAQFSIMRTIEQSYSENISELSNKFITLLTLGETEGMDITPTLAKVFQDKDTLQNALSASHDLHMLLIDQREDVLVSRTKTWLENVISDIEKDEIKRNRSKVLEISHYIDVVRDEFENLTEDLWPEDPEVVAILE